MYLLFYNLREKPFSINSDPRFLWYGDKHKEALANLKYGLREDSGYVVLTGDVGMGKTTLINALIETLDDSIILANINHPTFKASEFLYLVNKTFDLQADINSKADCLVNLKSFLLRMNAEGKLSLLIIDEAHRLPWETLEEIRLLSNMEIAGKKLINIFFVGQNELKQTLFSPECRALRQRITLFYDIQPLSEDETQSYVAHRLKVAGSEKQLFTARAIHQIYGFTLGYPRLINIVCNRALLIGYVREKKKIDTDIISECLSDISFLGPEVPETIFSQTEMSSKQEPPSAEGLLAHEGPQSIRTLQEPTAERLNNSETSDDQQFSIFSLGNWKFVTAVWVALIVLSAFAAGFVMKTKPNVKPDILIPVVQTVHEEKSDIPIHSTGPVVPQQPPGEDIDHNKDTPTEDPKFEVTENSSPTSATAQLTPETPAKPLQQNSLELATAAFEREDFKTTIELLETDGDHNGLDNLQTKELYSKALVGRAGQMMKESPPEAEIMLRKALEIDSKNVKAHFNLGKIFTQTEKYDLALESYQNAVAINPNFSDAFFNLGFIYARSGRYEKAEKSFAKVVNLKPAYLDKALFNLGLVQEKLGKKEESLANLQEAVIVGPDNQKIRAYLEKIKKIPAEETR